MMQQTAARRNALFFWGPLLFGIVFILLGIWILRSPVESYSTITKIIGVIVLISGTTQMIFTINHRDTLPGWGFQLIGDLFNVVLGVVLLVNPSILLKVITLFVGAWILVNSVSLLVKAGETKTSDNALWVWEFALGIILLVLAGVFFWHPMVLGITIAVWTALAFIVLGIIRIALTFRLRRLRLQKKS